MEEYIFKKSHFSSLLGFILVYAGIEGPSWGKAIERRQNFTKKMLFACIHPRKKPERACYPIFVMLSSLFFLQWGSKG